MNNIVLADNDDEYLTLNDLQMFNAFKYWQSYGLSYSNTTSYTDTINSIYNGSSTGSFTFTGSFGGSFDAAVSLNVLGSIGGADSSVAPFIWNSTITFPDNGNQVLDLTITPTGNGASNDYNATYACVYNPQNSNYTCSPNNSTFALPLTLPNMDVSVNSLRLFGTNSGSATIELLVDENVVGTLNGSLSLTGSGLGNFTSTDEGTTISTSVNINSLQYVLPIMKGSSIDNSYLSSKRISIPAGTSSDSFCIAILTSDGSHLYNFYDGAWTSDNIMRDDIVMTFKDPVYYKGGMNVYYIELNTNTSSYRTCFLHWKYLNRMFNVNGLIPLYVGLKSNMSDDMYRFIYGEDRLINLLENGNSSSNNAQNALNHSNSDFNSVSGDLVDLENNTFTGVDSAIDNVNLDSNILSFDGFTNAANWVRVQFDNLVSEQGFNNILVFSLSLGFALLIIGKVR